MFTTSVSLRAPVPAAAAADRRWFVDLYAPLRFVRAWPRAVLLTRRRNQQRRQVAATFQETRTVLFDDLFPRENYHAAPR